jgi:dTDP-3-amino-3,4,6-trideoxy-alpha-D-glucose transaminase
VLRARLSFLPAWTKRRRQLAAQYRRGLAGSAVAVPPECDPGHVYHLFVVRSRARAALQSHLAAQGIDTLVHYPVPITRQPAIASQRPDDCPNGDVACDEVLSLPLHPGLGAGDIDRVIAAVRSFHEE